MSSDHNDELIPRKAAQEVAQAMRAFRAVVIQGARQVGKSTLAQQAAAVESAAHVTFDDEQDLYTAQLDAGLYLDNLGQPAVIEEIQRAGDPFVLALKRRLDQTRKPGQYLLTGSSNFLTTPVLSESLAGRIALVRLWPLSMGEINASADGFVERALLGPDALLAHRAATPDRSDYVEMICAGGYPEAVTLPAGLRMRWHQHYLDTVLRREVQSLVDLRRFDALHRMARLLLASNGTELIMSKLAERLNIDRSTVQTYYPWLETVYLVHRLPAWGRNVLAKVVKRGKTYAVDTGLAASVMGKDAAALQHLNDTALGGLVEAFAVNEIAKQLSWSQPGAGLFHYRDAAKVEVDAVLEAADGSVVAVEVKAATLAKPADAAPMARLRDALDTSGGSFVAGVVLHTGKRRVPLGERLVGLPLADLWT